jgi:hypothetical protein
MRYQVSEAYPIFVMVLIFAILTLTAKTPQKRRSVGEVFIAFKEWMRSL